MYRGCSMMHMPEITKNSKMMAVTCYSKMRAVKSAHCTIEIHNDHFDAS